VAQDMARKYAKEAEQSNTDAKLARSLANGTAPAWPQPTRAPESKSQHRNDLQVAQDMARKYAKEAEQSNTDAKLARSLANGTAPAWPQPTRAPERMHDLDGMRQNLDRMRQNLDRMRPALTDARAMPGYRGM
jgi:cytochrome c551/c552